MNEYSHNTYKILCYRMQSYSQNNILISTTKPGILPIEIITVFTKQNSTENYN